MVGSESKFSSALSWADEVEKEEEARSHVLQKQKPNPFGSARPREVVLQERGIDWKKLDQDLLLQPSHIRNELKEKPLKENVPAPAPVAPSKGCLERKLENTKSMPPRQFVGVFVPSLRYPPKNVVANLLERPNLQYANRIGLEKGNTICFQEQIPHQYDGHFDQHKFQNGWESSEHAVFVNSRIVNEGQSVDALHNGRNSEISSLQDLQYAGSDCRRRKIYEQNLGSSTMKTKRNAIFIDDNRNCRARKGCVRERLMNPPSIETIQNRHQKQELYDPNKEKSGFQGNYKSRMVRSTTEVISWDKMKHDNGRQSTGKFVGPSVERIGDNKRAEDSHHMKPKTKMKMKMGEFGESYRKKELKSRPNGNQKRR